MASIFLQSNNALKYQEFYFFAIPKNKRLLIKFILFQHFQVLTFAENLEHEKNLLTFSFCPVEFYLFGANTLEWLDRLLSDATNLFSC